MFEFWEWVGGRYSLWSAIGLSIAADIGFDNFEELLAGANDMDEHFKTASFEHNIPVLLALMDIWNMDFLGAETHAILPYDQYLHRLPAYLQQAFMESNGKSVDRNGKAVNYMTSPVIWGEPGTNGQHSFYQLIHQGGRIIPADFIGIANSQNPLGDHPEKLFANFLAQTKALAFGKTLEEVLAENVDPSVAPHRVFNGNNPTNSILINKLSPRALGALIAMYEHQIFVEGVILNIFSFDQWGVQLGKVQAEPILNDLKGAPATVTHDSSTKKLLDLYKTHEIDEMLSLAKKDGGLEIPTHQNERYSLLVTSEFFTNGEFETHKAKYGDRFDLDRISGKSPEQFVDNILAKAAGKETKTVALVPNDLPAGQLERLIKVGIRFARVDASSLRKAKSDKDTDREKFQVDTYAMMLLLRRIDNSLTPDSSIYRLLTFYLKSHFALTDKMAADQYIKAILDNDVAGLIKGYLAYRPAKPYDVPNYNTVAAALISA
ncbi:MAG: hypothetical protein HQL28_06610 [Candidatus Omnitrophica bacterium]|nr:hypothetical protein [Candidatus Omnitrophota bacterium]